MTERCSFFMLTFLSPSLAIIIYFDTQLYRPLLNSMYTEYKEFSDFYILINNQLF